jgi:hypothetical protein
MDRRIAVVLAFVGTLLSLLVYLIAARRATARQLDHPDDYFLARRKVLPEEFAAAQIAYALQMSTVYPFFIFAFQGNWWFPLINTLFYLIGIYLLYQLLPLFSRPVTTLIGQSRTVHSFIARMHGAHSLQRLSSILTVIAFAGLTAFEIVFGAGVFRAILGGSDAVYYLSIAVLSTYLMLYLWSGGQVSAIRVDQFQLAFSYVGLHFGVAYLILDKRVVISQLAFPMLPLIVLIVSLIMFVYRSYILLKSLQQPKQRYVRLLYPFVLLSLLVLMISIVAKSGWATIQRPSPLPISESSFWPMVLTAALLPIFFQFVDLTNWQRVAALSGESPDVRLKNARKGILQYLLESPLSWALPILMGLCAPAILGPIPAEGSWDQILSYLVSGGTAIRVVTGITITIAVCAIFLSTADELLTAIGYAWAYDVSKKTSALMNRQHLRPEQSDQVIARGRNAMAIILAVVILLFIALDMLLSRGQQLLGLFLSFYTPMVAFAPAILVPAITGRAATGSTAWVTLVLASAVGIGIGVMSIFGDPNLQWYAAPISFFVAWGIYLLGFAIKRNPLAANVAAEEQSVS